MTKAESIPSFNGCSPEGSETFATPWEHDEIPLDLHQFYRQILVSIAYARDISQKIKRDARSLEMELKKIFVRKVKWLVNDNYNDELFVTLN